MANELHYEHNPGTQRGIQREIRDEFADESTGETQPLATGPSLPFSEIPQEPVMVTACPKLLRL